MDHLVRRECARADRNGEIFSLVLFPVSGAGRRRAMAAHRLARTMQKRARLTDDVGWLGQSHLAALLTDTSPQGARAFANGVADVIGRSGPRPEALVYSYPRDRAQIAAAPEPAGKINDPAIPAAPRLVVEQKPESSRVPFSSVEELLTLPTPRWKRLLDVVVAIVLAILLSPVLLIAAIAVKLTSPGPVIYTQRRSGLGGKPFVIFKFRTMVVGAEKRQQELRMFNEQDGPAFKLTRDPRVTRIGALLRKTSIDELPQLWNILKGDMSLVGPRPLPVAEQDGCEQWQRHRLNVTPGLTCIWQVKGRSTVSFADWVRMDVEYIRRRTILHDLSILCGTIPAVLLRRGAR